ncbi:hypothetical protein QMN58_29570, partial [Escherichia coli]|nr:hypothetical protein [Escherichia coli]
RPRSEVVDRRDMRHSDLHAGRVCNWFLNKVSEKITLVSALAAIAPANAKPKLQNKRSSPSSPT